MNKDVNELSPRVKSIIKAKALDMVTQLETTPFNITDIKLKTYLESNDFTRIRQEIGIKISELGKCGLGIIPKTKNDWILAPLEIIKADMEGANVLDFTGISGAKHEYDGETYIVYTRYYYNKGIPTLERYIETGSGIVNISGTVKLPTKYLPVQVFKNNFNSTSDSVETAVLPQMERLSKVESKYVAIYNIAKSQLIIDTNYNDKMPERIYENIAKGEQGFIEYDSANDRFGISTSITPSTNGAIMFQQHVIYEEMDIMSKLGLKLDSQQSGTNKHYFEVAMQSEGQLNNVIRKRSIRESEWNAFFVKLCGILGIPVVSITLELGFIAGIKLQRLKAEANPAPQQIKSGVNNE